MVTGGARGERAPVSLWRALGLLLLCGGLLALAVPAAFLGGALDLPTRWFQRLVGVVLLTSALRFVCQPRDPAVIHPPSMPALLAAGGLLGLLAGLTGTGGGVFLTPLMLLMG